MIYRLILSDFCFGEKGVFQNPLLLPSYKDALQYLHLHAHLSSRSALLWKYRS